MNAKAKMAVGYAFAACIVVFFVALLTVIFSFLGTFICAALAGMMMGAGRMRALPSMVVSIVFPMVLVVTFRLSHTEITAGHILVLAVICLAVFWVIYAAVLALISSEQKSQAAVAERAGTVVEPGAGSCQVDSRQSLFPAKSIETPAGEAADEGAPNREGGTGALILRALQGTWIAARDGSGDAFEKRLQIQEEALVLRCASKNGKPSLLARAPFTLSESECRLQWCDGGAAWRDSEAAAIYSI